MVLPIPTTVPVKSTVATAKPETTCSGRNSLRTVSTMLSAAALDFSKLLTVSTKSSAASLELSKASDSCADGDSFCSCFAF